jgi:hypothetical protein
MSGYTVKKVNDLPFESLVSDIPAGEGKTDTLFYSVLARRRLLASAAIPQFESRQLLQNINKK